MRLVIDTNVIFSALLRDGKTRDVLMREDIETYVPEFFFTELMNHEEMILQKSNMDKDEYRILIDLLFMNITIVTKEDFLVELEKAEVIMGDIDPDDSAFLALAMKMDCDLWSDDGDFEEQSEIKDKLLRLGYIDYGGQTARIYAKGI